MNRNVQGILVVLFLLALAVNVNAADNSFNWVRPQSGNVSFITNNITIINGTHITFDNKTIINVSNVWQVNGSSVNSNSTTWWDSLTGYVSRWFFKTGNNLDFNETRLNQTIETKILNKVSNNTIGTLTNGKFCMANSTTIICNESRVTDTNSNGTKMLTMSNLKINNGAINSSSGAINFNGNISVLPTGTTNSQIGFSNNLGIVRYSGGYNALVLIAGANKAMRFYTTGSNKTVVFDLNKVDLFNGIRVGSSQSGQKLIINRNASNYNRSVSLYIDSNGNANLNPGAAPIIILGGATSSSLQTQVWFGKTQGDIMIDAYGSKNASVIWYAPIGLKSLSNSNLKSWVKASLNASDKSFHFTKNNNSVWGMKIEIPLNVTGKVNSNDTIKSRVSQSKYNWTENSSYMSFTGNTLGLDETKLNKTINSSIDKKSSNHNNTQTLSMPTGVGTFAKIQYQTNDLAFIDKNNVQTVRFYNGTNDYTAWFKAGVSATKFTVRSPEEKNYQENYYEQYPSPDAILNKEGKIDVSTGLFSKAQVIMPFDNLTKTPQHIETDIGELAFITSTTLSEAKEEIEKVKENNQALTNQMNNLQQNNNALNEEIKRIKQCTTDSKSYEDYKVCMEKI